MADLRINTGLPAPAGRLAGDGAKTLAVRAAQKAFFDAALGQASPSSPAVSSASTAPVSTKPVAPVQPAGRSVGGTDGGQPTRLLRPGSLLDIRV